MIGTALALVGSVAGVAPSGPANAAVAGSVCELANDGSVYRYAGNQTWTFIGSSATAVYGGGYGMFGLRSDNNIYRFASGGVQLVGGPGATFAVSNDGLYGLSPNNSGVWQYSGSGDSWFQIGGAATKLYAGGYGIFAISPGTNNIIRYINGGWQQVGGPGATFAVSNNALYGLSPDRSAVWQYSGSGQGWFQIGGAARTIVACT